jgi:hypothetical protein
LLLSELLEEESKRLVVVAVARYDRQRQARQRLLQMRGAVSSWFMFVVTSNKNEMIADKYLEF